jgi:hypothetical protein
MVRLVKLIRLAIRVIKLSKTEGNDYTFGGLVRTEISKLKLK